MKGESMSDPTMCLCLSSLRPTVRPHLIPYRSMAHRPGAASQPAQPAYGQPAYGQPAPTANSYGQAVPTYGQPAPDANTYGQSAPAYGTPAPDAILTARFRRLTANTPRPLPLCRWISLTTDAPSKKPSCASGRSTRCSRAARPAVNSGGGCWPLSASI